MLKAAVAAPALLARRRDFAQPVCGGFSDDAIAVSYDHDRATLNAEIRGLAVTPRIRLFGQAAYHAQLWA
jgi:hypothetical protein